MKLQITKGSTSQIITVFIQDSSSTTGAGLAGLDQTSSIVGGYVRAGGTGVALAVNQNVTTEGTYEAPTTVAQVRIGTPANLTAGTYELHLHNDLLAAGADSVFITLGGASNMAVLVIEIQLTTINLNDGVRFGLTSLPNAAADANNGMVTGDGTVTFTAGVGGRVAVDVEALNGVVQTAIDLADFADAGYDPATNKVTGVLQVDTTAEVTAQVEANVTAVDGNTNVVDNLVLVYDADFAGNYSGVAALWNVNIVSVSDNSAVATNLELQYDGPTGLTGDTFPARQDQLNQIANIGGTAKRAAESYVLTTGTQSANTVSSTEQLDNVRHEHTDTAGSMDLYYQFNIGSGLATEVKVTGYLQGNNDDLEVYGRDWVSDSWKRIGTLNGQAAATNGVHVFDLLVDMVGSGANEGVVRVRFTDGAFTLTSALLAVDQILVEFSVSVEGYEGGAVWLDTNRSNTNTVKGIDGISSNPVSTIAAVNTLLAKTNLSRINVAPSSSFTLAATQANQSFIGNNWTLALGGQSISGSYIEGATISGIGTGVSEVHFNHCHFANVTLPPSDCEDCVLQGTFTIGTAGDFFFENCQSGIAGTSTPTLDFGSALNSSNVTFQDYGGGIELQNMGAGTGSYNMSLGGDGQLVINANCSATSTIAIRGHFPVTGDSTAIAAITFSEDARFTRSRITGGDYDLDTDANGRIRIVDGVGAGEINTDAGAIVLVKTLTTYTGNTVQTGDSYARIGAGGAGLTNINLPDQTMNITGDITGNLSGSVGSVTGAVGSVAGNVDGNVTGTVASVVTKTGYSLTAAGLDSIVVETGLNARQALSIIASASAGKLSGAASTTVTIIGAGVATTRIVATVDADGNRSAVTLTAPA